MRIAISCFYVKGTQAWDIFEFFLSKSNRYMSFVNFRKKFRFFSFGFRQNFDDRTFPRWLFLRDIQKLFFQNLHFDPIRWVPRRFLKILIFIGEFCILISDFWVIFENYRMHMLSICWNDFIACWSYAEHAVKKCLHMLSTR